MSNDTTPSKPLLSLDEADARRRTAYRPPTPAANGIACPQCQAELYDSNPGTLLTSLPPRVQVRCPACGWTGSRIA